MVMGVPARPGKPRRSASLGRAELSASHSRSSGRPNRTINGLFQLVESAFE
jgi:hypothetical protein